MEPTFQFYEIVKISSEYSGPQDMIGLEGVVLGRSQDRHGKWSYAVFLYDSNRSRMFDEHVLEGTGKIHENFYDGTSIRVIVDPDTGEGRIID